MNKINTRTSDVLTRAVKKLPLLDAAAQSSAYARHGIQVWTGADPDFPTKLDEALGTDLLLELGALSRFSVVVQNKRAVPVISLLLRLTMTDNLGRKTWGHSRLEFAKSRRLFPGGLAVLSPDAQISAALDARKKGIPSPGNSPPPAVLVSQFVSRFASQGTQTVSSVLDSVVLENGGVIGPDIFDVVAESNARNTIIQTIVMQVSDPTLTDGVVFQWISSQLSDYQKRRLYLGNGFFDHSVAQGLSLFQMTQNLLQWAGRSHTPEAIQRLSKSLFRVER